MGSIIIANQQFAVDAPVKNFLEPPYWDATKLYCMPTATEAHPPCTRTAGGDVPYGKLIAPYTRRYAYRPLLRRYGANPPLEAARAAIKQFIIHHDGCSSADMCWNVLQNERGLSCHFLIDNDGTIYQTIDLALMAYHAAEYNLASIGVELCCRGDAKKEPNYYARRGGPARDVKACKINNHTYLAYDYTKPQYDSLERLCRALTRLLPNIPVEYPQSSPGEQSWRTLEDAFSFAGYMGHYHCTGQKWDPGPFDFKSFCKKLRGSYCFPLWTKPDPKRTSDDRPLVPKRADELAAMAKSLYQANEQRADGGFFPVGPWGEHRLWHGGVHLAGAAGEPVFAAFPGRLVAARMGPASAIGSNNFVLVRHEMRLGSRHVRFYSLLMHLALPPAGQEPSWMQQPAWRAAAKPNAVVLLDEPIQASQLLGFMGQAGPAELAKAQLHMEIFAPQPIFVDWPGAPWEVVDGTAGGRFCDVAAMADLIDTNRDGQFSRSELANAYTNGDTSLYHKVVLHVSEWTERPDWVEALRLPPEFRKLDKAALEQMVAEQITPGLWWNDAVAKHAKLPSDGVVYHYHPVTFLRWINERLIEAQALGTETVNAEDAAETPAGVTDDLGDESGKNMRSELTEDSVDACDANLGLEQMVLGFDAPECTP